LLGLRRSRTQGRGCAGGPYRKSHKGNWNCVYLTCRCCCAQQRGCTRNRLIYSCSYLQCGFWELLQNQPARARGGVHGVVLRERLSSASKQEARRNVHVAKPKATHHILSAWVRCRTNRPAAWGPFRADRRRPCCVPSFACSRTGDIHAQVPLRFHFSATPKPKAQGTRN
jgi:hypothetical protein